MKGLMRRIAVLGGIALATASCAAPGIVGGASRGITWAPGSFDSIGEQIYFTAINGEGNRIRYRGGPPSSGMMMGGNLSCASCHGPDARGGRHSMHMEVMDAPDIRWSALSTEEHAEEGDGHEDEHADEYSLDTFRLAVVEGQHPDGQPLSQDMPRWQMSQTSLEALQAYLESLD